MRGCSPPKHRVPSGSQLPDIETAQPRDLVVEQVSVRHRRIDYHARHGAQAARWRDRREAERAPPESTMRYTRSPSTFSEPSSRPSFLRTTPAKKPRTECCCQWVARPMAAIVVPSARPSIRSAAAVMTDLLSGQVQLYFGTTASSLEYVRTGKLRALAVTIERRLDALPDITAVAESVPGYEASGWFGVGAPSNTPVEIIDKLNKEIDAGVADPKMKARVADLGGIARTGAPSDFGKLIVEETEKWGKVEKFAAVKAAGS